MNATAPPRRRVAVTGMGVLCPDGNGFDAYRRWLDAPGNHGRIVDFRAADYIANAKLLRSMHRTFELMAAAAVLAMRQANLPQAASLPLAGVSPARAGLAAALPDLSPLTPDLIAVVRRCAPPTGADFDWARFAETSLHQLHPFRRLTLLANMAAAHTSLLFGLQGPSFTFTSGPAAGVQVVTQAYWTIAEGFADLMVAQSAASPEQTFSADPEPEMAAGVVLETWDSAHRRGASILAEITAGSSPAPAASVSSSPASPVPAMLAGLLCLDDAQGGEISLRTIHDAGAVAGAVGVRS